MSANTGRRNRGEQLTALGSRAIRWSFIVLTMWVFALSGCGGSSGDDTTPETPRDAASDVKADARVDARPVGMDVVSDRTTPSSDAADAPPPLVDRADAPVVVADADAGVDVTIDVSVDVADAADVRTDSRDSTVEADARETSVDARPEAEAEAGPAVLVTISVTPATPGIANGTDQQFTATGTYSDTSTRPLTGTVTWLSTVSGVATISAGGLAHGASVGTTTIRATLGSVSGSTTLAVNPAVLESIAVTPPTPSIAVGTSQALTATGLFSDGTTQNLTASATWTSSITAFATVNDVGVNKGLVSAQSPGDTVISAAVGSVTGSTTVTVTTGVLVAISISPSPSTVANNTVRQFRATGLYSDGSTQDLTTQVVWTSSAEAVATIANDPDNGLATGITAGLTTIRAEYFLPVSGSIASSTTLTVTNATLISIAINPSVFSMARGTFAQFVAIGTFSDSSTQDITATATWASTNETFVTVSTAPGSRGLTHALAEGTTTITATQQTTITGTATITVSPALLQSISVTPSATTIANGTNLAFVATGLYSDNTTQPLTASVTWGSSLPAVAVIDNAAGANKGRATGFSVGQTVITAISGGITGSTTLNVSPATLATIQVTPANPSIAKGTTQQFAATGVFTDGSTQDLTGTVSWTSTDSAIASIASGAGSGGLATGVGNPTGPATLPQTVTITATAGLVTSSTTITVTAATLESIAVTPTNRTIPKGTGITFVATGTYSDSTTQDLTTVAAWGSSAANVASISNLGVAVGLNEGATTITATVGGTTTGSTTLSVTQATLQSIAVTPTNPAIARGTTVQFTAIGTFSDQTTQDLTAQVTWSSETQSVASVSTSPGTRGLATGLLQGTSVITAAQGTVSSTTVLTVNDEELVSIAVTPVNPTIAKGTTQQLTATGSYTDGSTQDLTVDVTWTSSADAVASVDNAGTHGLATGATVGDVVITATLGSVTGTTFLGVTPATLVSIAVTSSTGGSDPSIANGSTVQFIATGTYSDATTQVLTTQASWSSTNAGVAAISNAPASRGFATSTGVGNTTIRATFQSVSGSTNLAVTAATLDTISIEPGSSSIANGTTLSFHATGHYSDGSSQDITATVNWASATSATAGISNASTSHGLATSVAPGTTLISATLGSISNTTPVTLTVTHASLQSIAVLPSNRTVQDGTAVQYSASGHYSDNSNQDITSQVTWSSTNGNVALISNAAGSQGLATTVGSGTTSIHATLGGITGLTSLTATGP